ncbi:MAG: NIPSNAP family protein [Planctomycetota bacterium]|jgi:hypothetical protein
MKYLLNAFAVTLTLTIGLSATTAQAKHHEGDSAAYELRIYVAHEGKLETLVKRFRDHTDELFAKHGIESVGYWVPTDGDAAKTTLVYVVKHPSREKAAENWKAFASDPAWKAVMAKPEFKKLLAERPTSIYMSATDYSAKTANKIGEPGGVYEMRTYVTNPGKLPNLNARFRDHTTTIFNRHGIKNVAYWVPQDEPDSKNTLIYIIHHESREQANANWKAFGQDPEWKKVAQESQKDGKFLKQRPDRIYMKAVRFSKLK